MKVLILGAGYGTRLERDIKADQSGKYASLVGIPKPLIPINHRELISYWYDLLLHTRSDGHAFHPEDIYIVANQHNHTLYKEWATRQKIPTSNIINDGSTTNEARLGAIRDIVLAMEVAKIDEDLMVIGGDTLFFDDFDLGHVIQTFNAHDNNLVLWYPTEDTLKTGILVTDDNSIVTNFLEKPKPEATSSRKACPCFYIYKKQTLPIIKAYAAAARTLADVDAPGSLLTHLHSRSPVYAYPISGRFDIGGLDTYIEADDFFRHRAEIMHDKERQQQRWYAALVIGAIAVPLLLGGIYYFGYSSSSSRSKPSRR